MPVILKSFDTIKPDDIVQFEANVHTVGGIICFHNINKFNIVSISLIIAVDYIDDGLWERNKMCLQIVNEWETEWNTC